MIVAIIGSIMTATPTPLVEVQDTVVIVASSHGDETPYCRIQDVVVILAEDLAKDVIALKNEMVAYFPTIIASPAECCQPHYLNYDVNVGYDATNYIDNVLNWDCPIRGSPAI